MIALLKTVSIKTWIFIGLLTFAFGGMVFYYNNFNDSLVENGKVISENVILKDNAGYQEWSADITNKVVKEFVDEKVTTITVTQQIRKEAIDEYVKDLGAKQTTPSLPGETSVNSDSERISKLSKRMLDIYCTGRPEDPRCNSSNATK